MNRFTVSVASVAALLLPQNADAQTRTPEPLVAGVALVQRNLKAGKVSDFAPVVAAVDSGGVCTPIPSSAMMRPGMRILSLVFQENGQRSRVVNVTLDSLNGLASYTDMRGDLRAPFSKNITPDNPLRPATSVSINFAQKFGVVENRNMAEDKPIRVDMVELLDAQNLGKPRLMIEHVLRTCGGN